MGSKKLWGGFAFVGLSFQRHTGKQLNLVWIPLIWHLFKILKFCIIVFQQDRPAAASVLRAAHLKSTCFSYFLRYTPGYASRPSERSLGSTVSQEFSVCHRRISQAIREQLRLLRKRTIKRMLYTHFVIYLESKRKRHEAEDRELSLTPQKTAFLLVFAGRRRRI